MENSISSLSSNIEIREVKEVQNTASVEDNSLRKNLQAQVSSINVWMKNLQIVIDDGDNFKQEAQRKGILGLTATISTFVNNIENLLGADKLSRKTPKRFSQTKSTQKSTSITDQLTLGTGTDGNLDHDRAKKKLNEMMEQLTTYKVRTIELELLVQNLRGQLSAMDKKYDQLQDENGIQRYEMERISDLNTKLTDQLQGKDQLIKELNKTLQNYESAANLKGKIHTLTCNIGSKRGKKSKKNKEKKEGKKGTKSSKLSRKGSSGLVGKAESARKVTTTTQASSTKREPISTRSQATSARNVRKSSDKGPNTGAQTFRKRKATEMPKKSTKVTKKVPAPKRAPISTKATKAAPGVSVPSRPMNQNPSTVSVEVASNQRVSKSLNGSLSTLIAFRTIDSIDSYLAIQNWEGISMIEVNKEIYSSKTQKRLVYNDAVYASGNYFIYEAFQGILKKKVDRSHPKLWFETELSTQFGRSMKVCFKGKAILLNKQMKTLGVVEIGKSGKRGVDYELPAIATTGTITDFHVIGANMDRAITLTTDCNLDYFELKNPNKKFKQFRINMSKKKKEEALNLAVCPQSKYIAVQSWNGEFAVRLYMLGLRNGGFTLLNYIEMLRQQVSGFGSIHFDDYYEKHLILTAVTNEETTEVRTYDYHLVRNELAEDDKLRKRARVSHPERLVKVGDTLYSSGKNGLLLRIKYSKANCALI